MERILICKNALQTIPEEIARLKNLKVLDVSYNHLHALPLALANCNLQEINIQGCKDLEKNFEGKINSQEVLNKIKELRTETVKWNIVKVVVLGRECVGKTHLIEAIKGKNYKANISTNGIQVSKVTIKADPTPVKLRFFDFGGQQVFCLFIIQKIFLSALLMHK